MPRYRKLSGTAVTRKNVEVKIKSETYNDLARYGEMIVGKSIMVNGVLCHLPINAYETLFEELK